MAAINRRREETTVPSDDSFRFFFPCCHLRSRSFPPRFNHKPRHFHAFLVTNISDVIFNRTTTMAEGSKKFLGKRLPSGEWRKKFFSTKLIGIRSFGWKQWDFVIIMFLKKHRTTIAYRISDTFSVTSHSRYCACRIISTTTTRWSKEEIGVSHFSFDTHGDCGDDG